MNKKIRGGDCWGDFPELKGERTKLDREVRDRVGTGTLIVPTKTKKKFRDKGTEEETLRKRLGDPCAGGDSRGTGTQRRGWCHPTSERRAETEGEV